MSLVRNFYYFWQQRYRHLLIEILEGCETIGNLEDDIRVAKKEVPKEVRHLERQVRRAYKRVLDGMRELGIVSLKNNLAPPCARWDDVQDYINRLIDNREMLAFFLEEAKSTQNTLREIEIAWEKTI